MYMKLLTSLGIFFLQSAISSGSEPATQPAPADARAVRTVEPKQFMRLSQDGRGARLETAEVTFRDEAGRTVRLVGAIHIGERSYFESLNKEFEDDDAVLYELVKPRGAGAPAPGVAAPAGDNPISQMQHLMKDTLNLQFQLDVIDYTKPNFVHADLDRETFEKLQAERGETFEMLMMKQLIKAMTDPPAGENGQEDGHARNNDEVLDDLIKLVTRPDMERQIKLLVARQITQMELKGMGLSNDSVIVGERNKAAIKILADTLSSGKKKISIFYGAAHMPDLSEKLAAMGFKPVGQEWKTAWDLAIREDQPSAVETLLREAFKAISDDQ